MKTTLRLIISLIIIIALVATCFSFWQARQEEFRLKNELERRANIIADSLKISVESLLVSGDTASLQKIVEKFSNRERLVGIDIHDIQENPVLFSSGLRVIFANNPKLLARNIQEVERHNSAYGEFINLREVIVHAYSLPLITNDKPSHVLTIFHNADYIQERVHRIWAHSFLRALVQAFLTALAMFFIIYLNVTAPIRKATDWIRRIRQGESPSKIDPQSEVLLGPLANEITKMAKSLEKARLAAEEEARLRHATESLWTSERLKEFMKVEFGGRPLFVVSNREPYMHIHNGKEIECIIPASGLVTALEPILQACSGTWVAQGSGNADRETVDEKDKIKVPPEEPQYVLRRVWIEKEMEEGFYSGFSNEGLWPLCHIAHTRPIFREKDWSAYLTVNEIFAKAVLQELDGISEPCVLIQDYHFALLPQFIKAERPDARVAIFWHIPWPNPESFGICPWQKDLLQGMLGADIIGFHTQFHCNNFIETVDRFLESRIDYEHFTVNRKEHTTWIKPFPISIDFHSFEKMPSDEGGGKKEFLKKHGIQAEFIGVGVDRLDYTKGILERFQAIEAFLEAHPEYHGKFSFVELGAPSRIMIPKYKEFINESLKEAERINTRFQDKDWRPIHLLLKHHSRAEIVPFYRMADLCLVTSLHDGMNLVAKEFVSARDDNQGVLILSQFTGAARELRDALIVNPYDIRQTAEAIRLALNMPLEEQQERMRRMRNVLKDNNIYRWASELVSDLAKIRL
ncbi:MAG: trehalose-6-phosphate synthase [Kiritimatiellia bacterium]|nr:trehalose-6-phosphate synthase [Kiritimatiellia bacterium]